MDILFMTVPLALILALIFLGVFIYSVKKGQFEDLDTPSYRMLLDDDQINKKDKE